MRDDLRIGHLSTTLGNLIHAGLGSRKRLTFDDTVLTEIFRPTTALDESREMSDEETLEYAKALAIASGGEIVESETSTA